MTLTLRRKTLVVRTLVAAIGASFVSGCAVDPATGKPSFKETFASDDPCSQNARNIGIGVGVLAGALLGRQVGGDNKGLLVGAALGGVIGGLIGNDMDKRRCELSKIAKQYQLDVQVTALDNKGEAITTTDSAKAKQETAGSVVEIRDPAGAGGHFESNSDQLTSRARDYFTAIAATYDIRKSAAEIQDPNLRKQYLEKMLLAEIADEAGLIGLHHAETRLGLHRGHGHQCLGIGLVMRHQGAHVDIGNAIAIGEHEIALLEIVAGRQQTAARLGRQAGFDQRHFPRLGFVAMDFHPVVGQIDGDIALMQKVVGEEFLDQVTLVAQQDHELIEAVLRITLHDVPQDGLATDLHHRFRTHIGFFPKPRTQTAGENDDFQFVPLDE